MSKIICSRSNPRNMHNVNFLRSLVIIPLMRCGSAGLENFNKNHVRIIKSQIKRFSVDAGRVIPVVEYDEIKDLPNHPEKLLIDVREPHELQETGKIPTSINIPLDKVPNELSVKADANLFRKKYGREKPDTSTYIIFQCRSGKRSQIAAEAAVDKGYSNVKNYLGSWIDWAEHEGLPN